MMMMTMMMIIIITFVAATSTHPDPRCGLQLPSDLLPK